MHGLPPNIDLGFLVGQELQQVCIGRHEAILNFSGNTSICVESEFAHISNLGEVTALYKTKIPSAFMLVNFINATIIKGSAKEAGTLVLEFSNGELLEIYDSSAEYESYQIRHDKKIIVV